MIYNVVTKDFLFITALKIQLQFDIISYSTNTDCLTTVVHVLDDKINSTFKLYSPDDYFKEYYSNKNDVDYKIINELTASDDSSNIDFAINLIFTSNVYKFTMDDGIYKIRLKNYDGATWYKIVPRYNLLRKLQTIIKKYNQWHI